MTDSPADSRSQKQRMLVGEPYLASDAELRAEWGRAQRLTRELNDTAADDDGARVPILRALLGSVGEGCAVLPPFRCDYGANIHLGNRVFLNFGVVMLDPGRIEIGDDVLVGPGVQMLTADHPRDPQARRSGWESGRPITIGSGAWIGGGAIVLPGITVGPDAIVGAGAVVTRDVPAGATVAGNPTRVVG